jgi:hypothetical protein
VFFVARGRGGDFLRAKRDALKGLKQALHKRRKVQAKKRVTDDYLWSIMEKERYFPRLIRRFG